MLARIRAWSASITFSACSSFPIDRCVSASWARWSRPFCRASLTFGLLWAARRNRRKVSSRLLRRLLRLDQLPFRVIGMLNDHFARLLGAVLDGVGGCLPQLVGRKQDTLGDLDREQCFGGFLGLSQDLGAQIDGVTEQASLIGLDVGDLGVAGIAGGI